LPIAGVAHRFHFLFRHWTARKSGASWRMAAKPKEDEGQAKKPETPVPGPVGDGFPREKDVSIPPPGSDQAREEEKER